MPVGLRQFHETLRVFVVGKNYRLQNIQLSKIRLAGTAGNLVYVGSVGAPLTPPSRLHGWAHRPRSTTVTDVGP
jgi:hypothetical protein